MDNFYDFQQFMTNLHCLSQCNKFKKTERSVCWSVVTNIKQILLQMIDTFPTNTVLIMY